VKWTRACFLALLVGSARAQVPEVRAPRDVSARWAEYYAAVYQVPVELVAAIIDEESGWNPFAVSKKGAAGIMQLMPITAVRFGVRNRFLVQENIRGGVAYLAWLKQKFNGDLRLITAAYYWSFPRRMCRATSSGSRSGIAHDERFGHVASWRGRGKS